MKKKEIKEFTSTGWIRVNIIFEVVGNPKEHIEKALKDFMANLKTDSSIKVIEEKYAETEDIGSGLFSTFCEADMLIEGLEKMTWVAFNFTPASIEIVEPTEFTVGAAELQNWINDLLAKLHEVSAMSQQVNAQNKLLANNFNRLIKNSILLCIGLGVDTPKDIEEKIGIPMPQLKPFFEALIREGKLNLHDKQYKKVEEKPKKKK